MSDWLLASDLIHFVDGQAVLAIRQARRLKPGPDMAFNANAARLMSGDRAWVYDRDAKAVLNFREVSSDSAHIAHSNVFEPYRITFGPAVPIAVPKTKGVLFAMEKAERFWQGYTVFEQRGALKSLYFCVGPLPEQHISALGS
jgi:hypothetical protein